MVTLCKPLGGNRCIVKEKAILIFLIHFLTINMRKRKTQDLWAILLALLIAVGCAPKSDPGVPVEEIKLSERKITLLIGETTSIRASVSPLNAAANQVSWRSDNADVATVSDGQIQAKAEGETFIKAEADGKSAVCLVKVVKKHIPITALALPETIEMKVGDVRVADLSITPIDATEAVVWSSEDEKIVSVLAGELTAHAQGVVRISVQSGTIKTTTTITVGAQDVEVEGFAFVNKQMTLSVGEASLIETEIKASRPEDVEISWTSNNKEVATVTHGRVNALKAGKAIITATAGKFSAECEVEVIDKQINVERISITPGEIELTLGQSLLLKATTEPANLFEPIVWSSDDEGIVKVNQYGHVTSVAPGETRVHASIGGKMADCKVKVMEKGSTDVFQMEVTGITATQAHLSLKVKNPDMSYYVYALPKHKYNEIMSEAPGRDVSDFDMEFWKDQGKARWLEALRMDLRTGNLEIELEEFLRFLIWDTEYVVYCYGLDQNGVKTTETLTHFFKTQPRQATNLTFEVTIDEFDPDAREFAATIKPSAPTATYYISLQQQAFFDFYFNESQAGNKEAHNGWDPIDHMLWKIFLSDIGLDTFELRQGTFKVDRKLFTPKPYKFRKYELMVVGLDRKLGRTTEIKRVLVNP